MEIWKDRLLDALVGALVSEGIHLALAKMAKRLREKTPEGAGKHFKRS